MKIITETLGNLPNFRVESITPWKNTYNFQKTYTTKPYKKVIAIIKTLIINISSLLRNLR